MREDSFGVHKSLGASEAHEADFGNTGLGRTRHGVKNLMGGQRFPWLGRDQRGGGMLPPLRGGSTHRLGGGSAAWSPASLWINAALGGGARSACSLASLLSLSR